MSFKLGNFEVVSEIAKGGMGTVFEAFDPTLNRKVAIKLLKAELAKNPDFVEAFLREARNAAAISHPNIIQIHSVDQDGWQFFIVMELLTGHPLDQLLKTEGRMLEKRVLEIGIEATKALQAAYSREMVHGDIAPHNIWICEDGTVKILDFGLAKLANVEVKQSEKIWGSPFYMSPERVGQQSEDFRSDIYSLGATLYEGLAGHPPFTGKTIEEVVYVRLEREPRSVRKIDPSITKETEFILNKMLKKDINSRYPDYNSLLHDLREAYDTLVTLSHIKMTETVAPIKVPIARTPKAIQVFTTIPQRQPSKKLSTPSLVTLGIVISLIFAAIFFQAAHSKKTMINLGNQEPATKVAMTKKESPDLSLEDSIIDFHLKIMKGLFQTLDHQNKTCTVSGQEFSYNAKSAFFVDGDLESWSEVKPSGSITLIYTINKSAASMINAAWIGNPPKFIAGFFNSLDAANGIFVVKGKPFRITDKSFLTMGSVRKNITDFQKDNFVLIFYKSGDSVNDTLFMKAKTDY
jgi:serine/threonine protein kinase